MSLFRPLSLSALLLAASAPVFAASSGEAVQALPVPAAPALQVAPAVEAAPALPAGAAAAPLAPVAPAAATSGQAVAAPAAIPAGQAQAAPALPAAPATQAAPAIPAAAGLPAGAAALGGLINPQTLALIDQLRALQVTPQQAVGGVGALLGLAQNQLAGDQYAQLVGAVPGLQGLAGNAGSTAGAADGGGGVLGRLGALSGLLGGSTGPAAQPAAPVDSLAGVGQAFSVLGMDSSLVGSFGQILLQFLAGQGLAGALLQSLGGIWGVPGEPTPAAPVVGTPVVGAPVASGSGS